MYGQFHIKLVAQLDGLSIGILIYVLIVKNPIQITEKYSAMQCIVCICPPLTDIQQIFSISKIRRQIFFKGQSHLLTTVKNGMFRQYSYIFEKQYLIFNI